MATANESKFKVVIIVDEIHVALYGANHLSTVVTFTPEEAEQLSKDLAYAVTELLGIPGTLEMFEKEGGR